MSEPDEDDEDDEDDEVNLTKEMIQFCFVWSSGLVIGAMVDFKCSMETPSSHLGHFIYSRLSGA